MPKHLQTDEHRHILIKLSVFQPVRLSVSFEIIQFHSISMRFAGIPAPVARPQHRVSPPNSGPDVPWSRAASSRTQATYKAPHQAVTMPRIAFKSLWASSKASQAWSSPKLNCHTIVLTTYNIIYNAISLVL